jgi:hypothetical protein
MTNADWAATFVPIVAGILLAVWLTAVLRADTHPGIKHHRKSPDYEVTGGAFDAREGGRQLMPIPGQRPAAARPGTAELRTGQEQPGAVDSEKAGTAAERRHEPSAPG